MTYTEVAEMLYEMEQTFLNSESLFAGHVMKSYITQVFGEKIEEIAKLAEKEEVQP